MHLWLKGNRACVSIILLVAACQIVRLIHSFRLPVRQLNRLNSFLCRRPSEDPDLDSMKLTDLRALLRVRGGVPGNLRKAELIAQCQVLRTPSPQLTPRALANTNFAAIQTREYGTQKPIPPKATDMKAKFQPSTHENTDKPKFEIPVPPTNTEPVKRWSRNGAVNNVQAISAKPVVHEIATQPAASTGMSCDTPLWTHDDSDQPWRQTARHPYGPDRARRIERKNGEMELSFLGTASCMPGITRGVSCMAMRYITDLWLFDCGEGTQVQLRKSELRSSRINKIFITHLHGDHAFGLAGVLCMIGQGVASERDRLQAEGNGEVIDAIDIYGPEGIRSMVRAVMQLSYSKIAVPHRIHELKEIPCHYDKPPAQPVVNTRADYFCGERLGGTDIYPDASGKYHLFTENGMTVHAAPMEHTIPCVGYVVTEDDRPGALMPEKVADIVKRNKAALTAKYTALGRQAMSFYQDLKVLRQEETFTFPDGTEVVGRDIVLPPSKGRKIVFMGDTSSGKHIADLAQDCDVLVHEATNAYFPEDCSERRHTYSRLEEDTISHGHSTPEMAGRFAAQIRAKQLIMSHFSARYNGDSGLRSMQIMWRIEDMARRAHAEEQRRLCTGRNGSGGSGGGAVDHKNRGGRNDASGHRHAASEKLALADKSAETGDGEEVVLGENDVLAAWDFMCVSVEMKGAEHREKVKFKAVTTYD